MYTIRLAFICLGGLAGPYFFLHTYAAGSFYFPLGAEWSGSYLIKGNELFYTAYMTCLMMISFILLVITVEHLSAHIRQTIEYFRPKPLLTEADLEKE